MVLGLIVFLNITTISGGYISVPRYLTSGIAVLSVLAPQIIQPDNSLPQQHRYRYLAGIIFIAILVTGVVSVLLYFFVAKPEGWGLTYLTAGVMAPILLCLLIFWVCFRKEKNLLYLTILLISITMLTLPPAVTRVYMRVINQPDPYSRFTPLITFKKEVSCTTGNVLISGSINQDQNQLSRDVRSSQWMYNLFFRCHMTIDQFHFSENREGILSRLSDETFHYVFINSSDYDFLIDRMDNQILNGYEISPSTNHQYYLLRNDP